MKAKNGPRSFSARSRPLSRRDEARCFSALNPSHSAEKRYCLELPHCSPINGRLLGMTLLKRIYDIHA